jgi:hypothetical protein
MSDHRSIQELLARYVRAADARDGAGMRRLFVSDGRVEIYGGHRPPAHLATLEGADAIAHAVATMLPPHAPHGWSHHYTTDHLIEVDGDAATMDAQFLMVQSAGRERPAGGEPVGAQGPQGTVTPKEAGYYRTEFVRVDGAWRMQCHRIYLDFAPAMGGDPT